MTSDKLFFGTHVEVSSNFLGAAEGLFFGTVPDMLLTLQKRSWYCSSERDGWLFLNFQRDVGLGFLLRTM